MRSDTLLNLSMVSFVILSGRTRPVTDIREVINPSDQDKGGGLVKEWWADDKE